MATQKDSMAVSQSASAQETAPLSTAELTEIMEMNFDDLAAVATPSSQVFAKPELTDKDELVNQPFVILSWAFNEGDYSDNFVSVTVMNKANELLVFNDGSTGVKAQLQIHTERHGTHRGPIIVRKGLSKSVYFRDPESGEIYKKKPENIKTEPAYTFYLS